MDKVYELEVLVENASELAANDQEAFALIRRLGFGASDSSILLGVNPFPDGNIQNLIAQKQSKFLTASEMAIGQMVNVRKGSDLEPLILKKFIEMYKLDPANIEKPAPMFRIKDTPLNVNFDAIFQLHNYRIPVECKFISSFGGKYYDYSKAMGAGTLVYGKTVAELSTTQSIESYLTARAQEAGIPIYYYTQVQQQMMGLNAPFCYLTTLAEKDWESRTFCIMADSRVQQVLLETAHVVWNRIQPQ